MSLQSGFRLSIDTSAVGAYIVVFRRRFPVRMREALVTMASAMATEVSAAAAGRGGLLKPHSLGLSKSWLPGSSTSFRTSSISGDIVRAEAGSRHPGAALQETGGIVSAKRKSFMAIPLKAALDSRGVRRYTSPTSYKSLVVRRGRNGSLYLVRLPGRERRRNVFSARRVRQTPPIPPGSALYYRLARTARIPASGYISKTLLAIPESAYSLLAKKALAEAIADARS